MWKFHLHQFSTVSHHCLQWSDLKRLGTQKRNKINCLYQLIFNNYILRNIYCKIVPAILSHKCTSCMNALTNCVWVALVTMLFGLAFVTGRPDSWLMIRTYIQRMLYRSTKVNYLSFLLFRQNMASHFFLLLKMIPFKTYI